jgi:lipoprotein-anchoring transpeptidase ErfK/SrfK
MNRLLTVSIALAACFFASCAGTKSKSKSAYSTTYEPKVTTPTSSSAVKVKVSTTAQRVYVMEGDKVLLASPCSVGTAADPTPHGSFRISTKKFDRRRQSSPGAGYPMTYWMSFASAAYGMHWGFVKPYPCTHGCVRLPIKSAQKIFSIVKTGTPLHIAASHPEDATVGASLPLLDDSAMPDPPWSYMISPQVFKDAELGKFYTY